MSEKGTHRSLSTLSNSSPMLAAGEVDQASQTPDPQTGESGIRLDWRLLEGSPGSHSSLYYQHRLSQMPIELSLLRDAFLGHCHPSLFSSPPSFPSQHGT